MFLCEKVFIIILIGMWELDSLQESASILEVDMRSRLNSQQNCRDVDKYRIVGVFHWIGDKFIVKETSGLDNLQIFGSEGVKAIIRESNHFMRKSANWCCSILADTISGTKYEDSHKPRIIRSNSVSKHYQYEIIS